MTPAPWRETRTALLVLVSLALWGTAPVSATDKSPITLSGAGACLPQKPTVASHPDGGFVAAWEDDGVHLRRFDRRGGAVTREVTMVGRLGPSSDSTLTVAPSGAVALAMRLGSEWQIRFFHPDLTSLAPPVPLEDGPEGFAAGPLLAADGEDGFVAVWLRPATLAVARFDLQGRAAGPVHEVGPLPSLAFGGLQTLVAQPSGDLWLLSPVEQLVCSPPCGGLTVLRLAGGSASLETVRNGAVSFLQDAELAALSGGGVALALASERDVVVLRLDAAGEVTGPGLGDLEPVAVAGEAPGSLRILDLTNDDAGNLLLVWEDFGLFGDAGQQLRVRSLSPEAQATGSALPLTDVGRFGHFSAVAAPLPTGEAVVVWTAPFQTPIEPLPCSTAPGPSVQRLPFGGRQSLLLGEGRFRVEVEWQVPLQDTEGRGRARPDSADTGSFWFFDPDNLELTVKILDGRPVNGHFWFFHGALSNVGYRITVTDQLTGRVRTYDNPPGRFASSADTMAFPGGALP